LDYFLQWRRHYILRLGLCSLEGIDLDILGLEGVYGVGLLRVS
jgi:hypothetical protein